MRPLTLVLAAILPATAAAADYGLRAEAATGFDTNPLRETNEAQPAAYLGAVVEGRVDARDERGTLQGTASIGGRVFERTPDANVLATRLEGAGALSLGGDAELTASAQVRDLSEQGGVRSETGGLVDVGGAIGLGRVRLSLTGGFAASAPRALSLESFRSLGPVVTLAALWEPGARNSIRAAIDGRVLEFPRWTSERTDRALGTRVEWTWRGPVVLALGWTFEANHSTAQGGDFLRNRIVAQVAAPLPSGFSIALQGSLQRSYYPDGFYADQKALLALNDEQQNAIELRLSRPLGNQLEIAVKAAAYASEMSGGAGRVPYERELVQIGIGWRGE